MSSTRTRSIAGFVAIGGEVPFLNPHSIQIVGLDTPATKDNWFAHCPRLEDETDESLQEYLADVRRIGKIDEPIDVYRDGDNCIVLDGRRSLRVARMYWNEQAKAGVPEGDRIGVRALVKTGKPDELFRVNHDSHKKKPLTPTQRAAAMLTYHEATGEDAKKTAVMFSCTDATVKNMLKIFSLHADIQKAMDRPENPLAISQAIKLANLPREQQKVAYAEMEKNGAVKGARAANSIAAAKRGDKEKIGADDATRTRSRIFLEKLESALRKLPVAGRPELDPADLLKFVMGGPVPRGCGDDFKEILVGVGFKAK